jgi:hypothetical protein
MYSTRAFCESQLSFSSSISFFLFPSSQLVDDFSLQSSKKATKLEIDFKLDKLASGAKESERREMMQLSLWFQVSIDGYRNCESS